MHQADPTAEGTSDYTDFPPDSLPFQSDVAFPLTTPSCRGIHCPWPHHPANPSSYFDLDEFLNGLNDTEHDNSTLDAWAASDLLLQHSLLYTLVTCSVLGLITLATIVGNVFVIAAIVLERNLQNVANYLVASLAMADLMVAALVMPLAAFAEVTSRWSLGRELCDVWTSIDVLCCTSSILHLVAISLDRYWAVTRVDYIRNRSSKRIYVMIGLSWGISAVISIPPLMGWKDEAKEDDGMGLERCMISQDWGYTVYSTVGAFYLPLLLMVVIYLGVYRAARARIRKKHFRSQISATNSLASIVREMTSLQSLERHESSNSQTLDDSQLTCDSLPVRQCPMLPVVRPYPLLLMRTSKDWGMAPHAPIATRPSLASTVVPGTSVTPPAANSPILPRARTSGESACEEVCAGEFPDGSLDDLNNKSKTAIVNDLQETIMDERLSMLSCHIDVPVTSQISVSHPNTFDSNHSFRPDTPNSSVSSGSSLRSSPDTPLRAVSDTHHQKTHDLNSVNPAPIRATVLNPRKNPDIISSLIPNSHNPCPAPLIPGTGPETPGTMETLLLSPALSPTSPLSFSGAPNGTDWASTAAARAANNQEPPCSALGTTTPCDSSSTFRSNERKLRDKREQTRERKAARTLAIITGTFVVCWLPFFILALVRPFCGPLCLVPESLASVAVWLGYVNSLLNPVIYTVFNPDFRLAFGKILCGKYRRKNAYRGQFLKQSMRAGVAFKG